MVSLGFNFNANHEVIEGICDVGARSWVTSYSVLATILFPTFVFLKIVQYSS